VVTASRSLATAKAAAAQQQAGDIAPPSPATLGNQKKPDGHDGCVAPALRCSRPGRPLRSGARRALPSYPSDFFYPGSLALFGYGAARLAPLLLRVPIKTVARMASRSA
jgi:hypothetical protein